jgi:hypothetical protein
MRKGDPSKGLKNWIADNRVDLISIAGSSPNSKILVVKNKSNDVLHDGAADTHLRAQLTLELVIAKSSDVCVELKVYLYCGYY